MNENGHIYAPINTSDVAKVLKEKSNDVATLCMSEKINPYSLIRPFSEEMTSPFSEVKDLRTARIGADKNLDNDGVKWERKLWGYQVPYEPTTTRLILGGIRDIAWYRPTLRTSDHKNLEHFDGYLHNATPMFEWFVSAITGEPIFISFQFGNKQENIVSASGRANKGGVVSIPEVFGGEPFYFGVSIRINNSTTVYDYISSSVVNPDEQLFGFIDTGRTAENATTYEVTPWISNNTLDTPNARFYSLKFFDEYESYKTIRTAQESVSLWLTIIDEEMTIEARNTFLSPYLVSGITMHIEYIRRPDYDGSDITYPPVRTETRTINESIYVGGKDSAELKIIGERVKITLSVVYPMARVWLTGRAYNQTGTGAWQETMSNMAIVTQ